jgi:hypothetical protein
MWFLFVAVAVVVVVVAVVAQNLPLSAADVLFLGYICT